jgi:lauroyl/myristoyl acyltransferase
MRPQFITMIDFYLLSVAALIRVANWSYSVKVKLALVKAVTFLAYHLSKTKRRLSEQNLSDTFGGRLSQDQLQTIVKLSFYRFWLEAFSMPLPSVWRNSWTRVQIRGLEHLQRALRNRKGAILWGSNSFGRKFLAKQILHQNGFSICQIYGENHAGGFSSPCPASWVRRRIIRPFFDNCEKQYVADMLNFPLWEPLPVMRTLFGRLKQNGIICVAGDGTLGWNSVRKNFLSGYRTFFTGMVSLSRITGAPILPLFCIQEDSDKTAVIIEPPIALDSTTDRDRASELGIDQYVSLLESYIRRYPEQYRNWPWLTGFDSRGTVPSLSAR